MRCVFVAPDEWGDAKTPLEKRNVRIKVHLVHHDICLLAFSLIPLHNYSQDLTNADMDDKGVDVPFLDLVCYRESAFSI